MREAGMLIHKFETQDKKYIYDAATNRILEVDEVIYELIEDYGSLSSEEMIAKYGSKYDSQLISKRFAEIESIRRKQGCFSLSGPDVGFLMTRPAAAQKLESTCSTMAIEVTEQCNLRCTYCVFSGGYPEGRAHSSRKMSFEIAKEAIDYLVEHSYQSGDDFLSLNFYGGEPLLNFQLIKKCVNYCESLKTKKPWLFGFTTNLTILNPEILKFCIKHGIAITVSLDGPRTVHDRCRVDSNGKGSFDKVMQNLEMIRHYDKEYFRTKILFNIVLSLPVNWLQINDFFTREQGLEGNPLSLSDVEEGNESYFSQFPEADFGYDGYDELRRKFYEMAIAGKLFSHATKTRMPRKGTTEEILSSATGALTFSQFTAPLLKMDRRPIFPGWPSHKIGHSGPCLPGDRKLFVDVRGRLYPCEKVPYNDLFCIGNVKTGMDTDKAYDLIQQFYELSAAECSQCWAFRLCGQCMVRASEKNRFSRAKKLARCGQEKAGLHQRLMLYCSILEKRPDALDDRGTVSFS
ncbi:MAG: radical SAM protein [Candidatus Omnitrophota bacterium]